MSITFELFSCNISKQKIFMNRYELSAHIHLGPSIILYIIILTCLLLHMVNIITIIIIPITIAIITHTGLSPYMINIKLINNWDRDVKLEWSLGNADISTNEISNTVDARNDQGKLLAVPGKSE